VRQRRLGVHGPNISVIGLGTWGFGGAGGFGLGAVDDQESIATIRHAVESGINWVDTAAVYGLGHSEEVVGRALAPFKIGDTVYIFTKGGQNWSGGTGAMVRDLRPESIRSECEQSLKRLGVERIDLYQFHWPDAIGTAVEDSWATMIELIDQGKVRWGGVSNFDVSLLARCHMIRPVDSEQVPLSLINRASATSVIPWCRANGIGVIVYAPLATGLLTGTFDRARIANLPDDDGRRRLARFQEPQLSRTLGFVDHLRPMANRLGVSAATLAIAWTLVTPGVTGAIVGARTPVQVDGWLSASDIQLSKEGLAQIDAAIVETGV
jgi:aryl-alcohol dehydrogenase-like predicted oxidoreductase